MKQKTVKKVLKELKSNESNLSMVLGGVVVLIVGILLFKYFKSTPTPQVSEQSESSAIEQPLEYEQTATGEKVPKNLPTTYTVVAGDNLWRIAEKYYGSGYNWVDIASENKLANSNVLMVGSELSLPKVAVIMPVAEKAEAEATTVEGGSYTVVKGDSLWDISVRAYGDGYQWTKVYQSNKTAINDPGQIEVGMVLTLPR